MRWKWAVVGGNRVGGELKRENTGLKQGKKSLKWGKVMQYPVATLPGQVAEKSTIQRKQLFSQ